MVGYDGSDGARRALDRAADLAGYGSTVSVVNVARSIYAHTFNELPDIESVETGKRLLAEARDRLAERQVTARVTERVGDAADELVEAAAEEAVDLLVVGRRGGSKLARLVLGSVSREVVAKAPCDVLVVH